MDEFFKNLSDRAGVTGEGEGEAGKRFWTEKIFKRCGEDRQNNERERGFSPYLPIILNSYIDPEQDSITYML